jgi:hypothetical protein
MGSGTSPPIKTVRPTEATFLEIRKSPRSIRDIGFVGFGCRGQLKSGQPTALTCRTSRTWTVHAVGHLLDHQLGDRATPAGWHRRGIGVFTDAASLLRCRFLLRVCTRFAGHQAIADGAMKLFRIALGHELPPSSPRPNSYNAGPRYGYRPSSAPLRIRSRSRPASPSGKEPKQPSRQASKGLSGVAGASWQILRRPQESRIKAAVLYELGSSRASRTSPTPWRRRSKSSWR